MRAANPILTDANLRRVTLGLAGPVFLSRLLHTLFHLANVAWVGRIGSPAIAAVTTSIFVMWTVQALGQMVSIGATSFIARHLGAGNRAEGARAAGQGFFAALGLGVVLAAAGLLGAGPLFRMITRDAVVATGGAAYLRIATATSIITVLMFMGEAIYRASGNTRTPMIVLMSSLALNIVLDPLLILGVGPFPRLGVPGAAITTAVSQAIGLAIYVRLILARKAPFTFREMFGGFRPDRLQIRRMLGVGAPLCTVGILFSLVYVGLSHLASAYGTPILAALGVVNRLEGLSYLTAEGFGVAATTMMAQNLGARQIDRADRMVRTARRWSIGLTGVYALLFLALPRPILSVFTSDPVVVERGALFLAIVALAQPFMGIEIALEGALAGAGDTRPAMWVAVPLSLIRIPIAMWLTGPMGMGAVAIWWTLSITAILRGIFLDIWYRRGGWRTRGHAAA